MTTPKNDDEALCLTVAEVGKELYENRIRLSNGHPAASIEMAIRALQSAYERALNHYQTIDDIDQDAAPDKWISRPPLPNGAIQSASMQKYARTLETELKGATFSAWLTFMPSAFETQIFDRLEIQRWIDAIQTQSGCDLKNAATIKQTATPPTVHVPANGRKWTPEKLVELKACREAHTMPETAKKFGISEQRIRQLLPSKKPKATPFTGLIHRTE